MEDFVVLEVLFERRGNAARHNGGELRVVHHIAAV